MGLVKIAFGIPHKSTPFLQVVKGVSGEIQCEDRVTLRRLRISQKNRASPWNTDRGPVRSGAHIAVIVVCGGKSDMREQFLCFFIHGYLKSFNILFHRFRWVGFEHLFKFLTGKIILPCPDIDGGQLQSDAGEIRVNGQHFFEFFNSGVGVPRSERRNSDPEHDIHGFYMGGYLPEYGKGPGIVPVIIKHQGFSEFFIQSLYFFWRHFF